MRRILIGLVLLSACAGCGIGAGAFNGAQQGPAIPGPTGTPRQIEPEPYARVAGNVIDLNDSERPVDDRGVLITDWPGMGPVYHPVALAQYGLYTFESFRFTDDPDYLDRAIANAEALLSGAERRDDELWFAYGFDYAMQGDPEMTLHAPWYSGMAQGQALSLFARLYEETGDDRWRDAAEGTFATFLAELTDGGPSFRHTTDDGLWFEEYAGDGVPPTQVVNGHIYALFGLYDWAVRGGAAEAAELFDLGAQTVEMAFGDFRVPDGISYYCASDYCRSTGWQPPSYHRGVAAQFESLALMTGDGAFLEFADTFDADYAASGASG